MSNKTKNTPPKPDGKPALTPKLRFPEFRDSWRSVPLGKCFTNLGGTALEKYVTADGTHHFISIGNYSTEGIYIDKGQRIEANDVTRTKLLNKNDLVMVLNDKTLAGNIIGSVLLIDEDDKYIYNQRSERLIVGSNLTAIFAWHLLNSPIVRKEVFKRSQGRTQIYVNFPVVKAIKLVIPHIHEEQQKIAECLSSVDELITAQARKLDALKTHKKGLMQQLFPRAGETQPRLRFPEFQNAGEWEEKRLDEIAHYENGKAHENDISDNGRYIVVNSKFISTEGEVRKFSDEGFCVADAGNVLMVLSDVPNGRAIAKCYFVESDDLYTVNQRICKIQPTKVNGRFLFYILDRNSYFLDFDDGVKQTNLRKEDVLGCPLSVPPLQDEQQRIADCLTSLDDLIAAQTQKLEALKTHKKGLMQQLFPSPESE